MSDPTRPSPPTPCHDGPVDAPFIAAIRYLVELGRKRRAERRDQDDDQST